MPVNLSIKNALALLKQRAQRNHRSLQGEMLAIIEEAVCQPRRMTVDEVLEEAKKLNLGFRDESAQIVRQMRDERCGC